MKKDKIKQSKRESSSNESDSDIQEDEDVKEEKEQKQSGDQKPKEPKAKKAGKEKKSRDVFTKARAEKVQNAKEVCPLFIIPGSFLLYPGLLPCILGVLTILCVLSFFRG